MMLYSMDIVPIFTGFTGSGFIDSEGLLALTPPKLKLGRCVLKIVENQASL
jgi:hypothetical protein